VLFELFGFLSRSDSDRGDAYGDGVLHVEQCPNVRASSNLFNTEEELEALAKARSRL